MLRRAHGEFYKPLNFQKVGAGDGYDMVTHGFCPRPENKTKHSKGLENTMNEIMIYDIL